MPDGIARVALYLKAPSIDRANDREQVLRDYAAQQIGGHIDAVFTDLGTSRRRCDLNAAISGAQDGRFDVLLVHSVRDLTGAPRLRELVERFQAASVTVGSLAEQFDSSSWSVTFWLALIDADNDVQLARTRRGIKHAARRGRSPSRPRCVGPTGPVSPMVEVKALYAAAVDEHLSWLDDLLIAASVARRCGCTAAAPADGPCPLCGAPPPAASAVRTGTPKDGDR